MSYLKREDTGFRVLGVWWRLGLGFIECREYPNILPQNGIEINRIRISCLNANGFGAWGFAMSSRKLEHGFRMIRAGIPYALPQGHEDNDVPTSSFYSTVRVSG